MLPSKPVCEMATKLSGYTLGATLGIGEYGKAIQCTRDDDGAQAVVKQVGRRNENVDKRPFSACCLDRNVTTCGVLCWI